MELIQPNMPVASTVPAQDTQYPQWIEKEINDEIILRGIDVTKEPFNMVGNGVYDNTAAMLAIKNYLLTFANPPELVFPQGIYLYSSSPNWAINNLRMRAEGVVRLRYTGTGRAFIVDGSVGAGANVWNMTIGQFIIEAPNTATDGFYMDNVHHSKISAKVRGCGTNYAAFHIRFAVCNTFDNITVTSNEEGWYLAARPKYGIQMSKLIVGEIASYNTFINPIIEHTVEGAQIDDSLGNIFIGGTMEGCLDNGLNLGAAAGLNKFYGMDFEANVGNDIVCAGFENQFYGCDSANIVDFQSGAINNAIHGGSFKNITLESGSHYNLVHGANYNRQLFDGTTGTLTDASTYNRLVNNMDVKLAKVGNRPATVTTITPTGSVFVYTNTSGNDERILITGGTISQLALTHGGIQDTFLYTSPVFITLSSGDALGVTYSVAPTMRKYTT